MDQLMCAFLFPHPLGLILLEVSMLKVLEVNIAEGKRIDGTQIHGGRSLVIINPITNIYLWKTVIPVIVVSYCFLGGVAFSEYFV